ncbi:hypothetical protein WH50_01550 [Pokkaliibacter plantistimulans]|uniref:Thiol:disulfide interchange protein n=2 Tax=Pseudomonadota TaxID=1224 RepID=A0ABX5M7U4_9GAMM|nr:MULTISPECIES: thiol:disulfide interchange protein DsbA/DsbL [Pokkaliibacter]MDH2433526.1 thiol:disulfide interchange protein DsbA/DsbL [Pokkaliibacter sp. MBI-7]PPC78169.1 disulfide bond formation protein DsbA [Pokkaliibacter plantistimulans]PXF32970.1 hypothetical protein WH50_01550 [Pokkaliibacter plantistimulans]
MLKAVKAVLVALCLLPLAAMADETFEAGKDYRELTTPMHTADPSKIEVIEFFSYGCPHCNAFDPMITPWSKQLGDDVQFEHVPVVFHKSWDPLARAYYVTTEMGVEDKVHTAIFNAIHVQKENLFTEDNMVDFMGKQGLDKEAFRKMYESFATDMRLKKGDSLLRGYGVNGVPALVVNGKYVIEPTGDDAFNKMLKTADFLIAKERAAKN